MAVVLQTAQRKCMGKCRLSAETDVLSVDAGLLFHCGTAWMELMCVFRVYLVICGLSQAALNVHSPS